MDEEIITEDELVAALLSVQTMGKTVEGALTTNELAKIVGRRVRWVREQLKPLISEGKIESVRTRIVDIAGRSTIVPAYRLRAKDGDKRSGTDILT